MGIDRRPLDSLAETAGRFAEADRSATMRNLASAALMWVRDAYLVKAGGGTDAWGQRWRPLSLFTIAARLLRTPVGRAVLRRMPRGPSLQRNRAAVLMRAIHDPRFAPAFYAAIRTARLRIGIASGRLLASLDDGAREGLMIVGPNSASIGTEVPHGPLFDALRPVFPQRLTDGQEQELEDLAARDEDRRMAAMFGAG